MHRPRVTALAVFLLAALAGLAVVWMRKRPAVPVEAEPGAVFTVADRLEQFGTAARARLTPDFAAADVRYPPGRVVLAAFKHERRLDLYAAEADDGPLRFIRSYPVLAASGTLGPKLREGDRQVPEGIYRVTALNPNSRFHLSLRVSYPNAFDRERAGVDGRTEPGSDIMIHGAAVSAGCLAMGDPAVEELFVLAADTGLDGIVLLISPWDARAGGPPPDFDAPEWMEPVYEELGRRIGELPRSER